MTVQTDTKIWCSDGQCNGKKTHSSEKTNLNYFHDHSRVCCVGLECTMTCGNE